MKKNARSRSKWAWLLASASALVLSEPSLSEPVQPFWLIPSALADTKIVSQKSNTQPTLLLRSPQHTTLNFFQQDLHGWNLGDTLPFRPDASANSIITVKFQSAPLELQTSPSAGVHQIARGLNFSGTAVPIRAFAASGELWDGRIQFSNELLQPVDLSDARDFRDPQLKEQARTQRLNDIARRHRFAAKVIDSGNLRLMIDGEFGQITDDFTHSFAETPRGQLVLPGSWSNLSSQIEYGRARLSVGYQDFDSSRARLSQKRVTIGVGSSALSVYRKQANDFNLINGGQWLKRTSFSGIDADLIVADFVPDAIADAIDPIRPFLPTSISANFERGDVFRSEITSGPRERVSTSNVSLTWNTQWGETTASAWERKITTDLVTPANEDGVELSKSRDRYVDISHKVRRGNWKLGAGLSLIQTDDTSLGFGHQESEIAPHVSIAYAPERGPKVELRFGAADAQSQLVDDNLAARAKTRQLQLSVDVSDYVREELNLPDARLQLEYRYDFGGSDRDPISGRDRSGGHALLVTYSTPLN